MKKVSVLVSIALALLFMPLTISFAGGSGGGSTGGGGTGGNSSEPLELVSSTIVDGQTEVGLTPSVTMVFSKNVTDLSVKEANLACFKLEKKAGGEVAYEVLMADSQVEPDKKNDVVVKPLAELEADTEYIVTISKALTSKSGASLADDIVISFTTAVAGGETDAAAENTAVETPAAEAPTAEAPAAEEASTDNTPSSMVYIIASIAAVILIGGYWMKKKRS